MKKFTLLFLFFSLAVSAQLQVFPILNPTLLKPGMKVKPNDMIKGTWTFQEIYSDSTTHTHYKPGPDENRTYGKALEGREFEVVNVRHNSKNIHAKYYIIKLKDVANQEIIYYNVRVSDDYFSEFTMIDTVDFPADYFCPYVTTASNGELIYISFPGELKLEKYEDQGKMQYILNIKSKPFKKNSGKGTVTLNLKNGKKIIKKNITGSLEGSNQLGEVSYGARLHLTKEEVKLLMESEIISCDFFGLYQEIFSQQMAGVLRGSIECYMKR